jgi:hypothetical protein
MFNGVYTGTSSWLTHPTSNYLPALATNVICVGSYVNSLKDPNVVSFVGPVAFETVNVGRIGKGTSIEQDPGTIKERAKLYAYMSLIPVLNGVGLGTSLLIYRKNESC